MGTAAHIVHITGPVSLDKVVPPLSSSAGGVLLIESTAAFRLGAETFSAGFQHAVPVHQPIGGKWPLLVPLADGVTVLKVAVPKWARKKVLS